MGPLCVVSGLAHMGKGPTREIHNIAEGNHLCIVGCSIECDIRFKEMFHIKVETRLCTIIEYTWVTYGQTHILPSILNKAIYRGYSIFC